jgi:hypothetical protein
MRNNTHLKTLHAFADVMLKAGAFGSLLLVSYSIFYNNASFLEIFLAGWVLFPFIGFRKAIKLAPGWSVYTAQAIYLMIIFVSAASLIVYGFMPRLFISEWVFLSFPPISWLLLVTAIRAGSFLVKKTVRKEPE